MMIGNGDEDEDVAGDHSGCRSVDVLAGIGSFLTMIRSSEGRDSGVV